MIDIMFDGSQTVRVYITTHDQTQTGITPVAAIDPALQPGPVTEHPRNPAIEMTDRDPV